MGLQGLGRHQAHQRAFKFGWVYCKAVIDGSFYVTRFLGSPHLEANSTTSLSKFPTRLVTHVDEVRAESRKTLVSA